MLPLRQDACRPLCPDLVMEQLQADDDLLAEAAVGGTADAACRVLRLERVAVGAAEEAEEEQRMEEKRAGPKRSGKEGAVGDAGVDHSASSLDERQ